MLLIHDSGIKFAEASKIANQLTFRWEDDPGLSGRAEERTRQMAVLRRAPPLLLALTMEGGG